MQRSVLIIVLFFSFIAYCTSQNYSRTGNAAYKYNSNQGFVNLTELSAAQGIENTCNKNAWYYFGFTNIFGHHVGRNFICGAGTGLLIYDSSPMIPLFIDLRYTTYFQFANPFFYTDAGVLLDPGDMNKGMKVFINPGIGLSRSFSPKLEGTFGTGLMVQMGQGIDRASFVNIRLGLIFRKHAMRLYNPSAR